MGAELIFRAALKGLMLVVLTVAATTDIARKKVYDWLTLPAIALGLTLQFAAGGMDSGVFGLASGLTGLFVGFGLFFLAFAAGGMSGGDVKLAAAIGAIGGWPFIVPAIVWSSLVGAGLGLGLLIWQGRLGAGLAGCARALAGRSSAAPDAPERAKVRYGVAIAAGTMLAFVLEELAA